MSSSCSRKKIEEIENLGKQSDINLISLISEELEKCKTIVADVLEEIERLHSDQLPPPYLFQKLCFLSLHLMVAEQIIHDRAVSQEGRLEKLEKQFQELKKLFPVGDGK